MEDFVYLILQVNTDSSEKISIKFWNELDFNKKNWFNSQRISDIFIFIVDRELSKNLLNYFTSEVKKKIQYIM